MSFSKPKNTSFGSSTSLYLFALLLLAIALCTEATFLAKRSKRQSPISSSSDDEKGSSGTIPYSGDQSSRLRRWGRIAVGTPAKEFRVAFDMESSDLWLIHPNASINEFTYSTMPMASPKVRYDSSQSSSSVPSLPGQTFNSSSGVSGTAERDNITVAGVPVRRPVQFGAAIDGIPEDFVFANCYTRNCNFDVDGKFGLAPGPVGSNSILRQLTGALKEPVVTINSKGLYGKDGAITFGDVDRENCDPEGYEFVPLAEPRDNWATNLLEIRIGNVSVNATGTRLEIIDKYADLVYVPETQFHAIGKALGAVPSDQGRLYYRFPKVKADIVLVIGSPYGQKTTEIVLKYPEYMYQSDLLKFVAEEPLGGPNNNTFYITAPLMVNRCFALNWAEGSIAVSTAKNATSV